MAVDSVERQFIVVRPSAPTPAAGYAAVIMLHGATGDGQKFYNISGWKEKGEQEGFVTVLCFVARVLLPQRLWQACGGDQVE